jgi:hypothetical protein
MWLSACHNSPCPDPGFDEGERFQVTVVGATQGPCPFVAPLAAGDSFVLTGGAALTDPAQCTVRGASPEVPGFAAAVLSNCREALMSLGLDCAGMVDPSCSVSAQLRLGPRLERGVATVPGGVFSIVWSTNGCNGGGCRESYDVRIDRLGGPPQG